MFCDCFMGLMQTIGICTCAIIGYILFFHFTTSADDQNWNFFIKKRWAYRKIRKSKCTEKEMNDEFNNYSNEEPKALDLENSTDTQMFYGSDQHKNSVLIKITRRKNKYADVWLILELNDGSTFTLPEHPDTRLCNANENEFEARGLNIQCLVPFSKWRITFNGMLRRGIRNRFSIDYQDDELEYVKFKFIWTTASTPIHFPNDWSADLISTAIAAQPWTNGKWMKVLTKSNLKGYDQFGTLFGQIFLQQNNGNSLTSTIERDPIELNLPGIRQRRWILADDTKNYHRQATIMGVCTDGSIYIISAYSLKYNLSHVQFGIVRQANGDVHPIDWTDFHLSAISNDPDVIQKAMTIRFTANGRTFSTTIHLRNHVSLSLIEGRPINSKINITPLEIGLDGNRGFGIAIFWYPYVPATTDVLPTEEFPIHGVHLNDSLPNDDDLCYALTDFEAHSISTCGGKGSSLAILTSCMQLFNSAIVNGEFKDIKMHNFNVPKGFCLSVAAFDLQIQRNENIQIALKNIENIAYGSSDTPQVLQIACEKATKEIQLSEIHPIVGSYINEIFDSLQESYKKENDNKSIRSITLAVRSSGTCEDSEETSSAGQNATYLGLKTLDEVQMAVKNCWASLYSYRSVEYRRQHIQPIISQIAVVIQIMVPSDCAGVLFTTNPTSGDPTKLLITANYGLGESVVSGAIDPDMYIVKRFMGDRCLKIVHKYHGTKTHRIDMTDDEQDSRIKTIDLNVELQKSACLNDEQITKLSEIGIAIEKMYGSPRDIEWAFYDNQFHLLQARPITMQRTFSDWELLHEFDSAIMSPDELLTTANVGEVFPFTVTPLTSSLIVNYIDKGVTEEVVNKSVSPLYQRSILCSQYRVFLDVYSVFLRNLEKEIDFSCKVQSIAVFGHEYLTNEMHKIAIQRHGFGTKLKKIKLLWHTFKRIWNNKKVSAGLVKFMNDFRNQYSSKNLIMFKSSKQLYYDLLCQFDKLKYVSHSHSNISGVCVTFQVIILSILCEDASELTTEHYADMGLMLGSCKDVESAEIPMLLEEIANAIIIVKDSMEFENMKPVQGIKFLETNCPMAYKLFEEFLRKHNHRCLQEFDLASETWGMQPSIVMEMIQTTVRTNRIKTHPTTRNDKNNYTDKEIVDMLKTPKKNSTRMIISKLLPLCKSSVQLRETSKSNFIEMINELRRGFIRLSELMYAEGLLPQKKLIFYLTVNEIENIILNKNIGLINKCMRRMKLYPMWYQLSFNEMNVGLIKSNENRNDTISATDSDGSVIVKGTPVSSGKIIGRACVLKYFSEVSKIEMGDILITHSTDIGWSPYFPILGGVVTELGGLISHGAVVAREYGLPCIVGAVGATDIFKFGDRIMMDASKGIIKRIEKADQLIDDMLF